MIRWPLLQGVFAAGALVLAAAVAAQADSPVLKTAPKEGDVPYRKVVLVDDGTCPKGEIKEITGGSREKNVPRKVRCVQRPDKLK